VWIVVGMETVVEVTLALLLELAVEILPGPEIVVESEVGIAQEIELVVE
jgi:hypothetical protein